MTRMNENYIWLLFGVLIFSVLIALYIDDRRKLIAEETVQTQASETSSTNENTEVTQTDGTNYANSNNKTHSTINTKRRGSSGITNMEFTGTIEEYLAKYGGNEKTTITSAKKSIVASETNTASSTQDKSQASHHTNSSDSDVGSSSRSMDDYLAETSQKHDKKSLAKQQAQNAELLESAKQHTTFSGSIQEYLASFTQTAKEETSAANESSSANKVLNKTTQVRNNDKNSRDKSALPEHGFSGTIDGYLSKYRDGNQTPLKKGEHKSLPDYKPFEEHDGFHGSYEEYARLYTQ